MASDNLEEFRAETAKVVATAIEEARDILRRAVVLAFQDLVDLSPEGKDGRYRASHRVALGAPLEDKGEPGGPHYGPPSDEVAKTIADITQLGDVVWFSNNVGYGESKKTRSYAFFIEYGARGTPPNPVYEKASFLAEQQLTALVDEFNGRTIA